MLKVELSRAIMKRGPENAAKVFDAVPASLGRALGGAVRERVSERGDLAGQPLRDWDPSFKPYVISARYPDHVSSGETHWSGAELWPSSHDYHAAAGAQRGAYKVSGGMWAGLSLVIWSEAKADILFRGRSEGQSPRIVNGKSRPIKVSNALKAWTVLRVHRVLLLAISERELTAITDATTQSVALAVTQMMKVEWSRGAPPTVDVGEIFRRALQVRTPIS